MGQATVLVGEFPPGLEAPGAGLEEEGRVERSLGGWKHPARQQSPRRGPVELLGDMQKGRSHLKIGGKRRVAGWLRWPCKDVARCGQQEGHRRRHWL